jgi:hypothetical protein
MREVSYKVERPFADRIDYVCKGHLSHLVKARLRGASAVTVEKA